MKYGKEQPLGKERRFGSILSKKVLLLFSFLLLLFGIWECLVRLFPHLLFVLPPPTDIFSTLWVERSRFYFHTLYTLKEMLGGFLLALCAAFPLAWIMMRYHHSRFLLQPMLIVIQCLPMFTLAPIMVIWFGWSFTAIVVPTALMIFFPLTLNIYQGLRSTPHDLLEFFQTNHATPWQTFFKLRLPWAIPHIFAGFRISAAIAGIGAVAGEWAGAQNGLGMLMLESRRYVDLEMTFGAIFWLTFISTTLYCLILYCEKLLLPPHRSCRWKKIYRIRSWWGFTKKLLPLFLLCTFGGCQRTEGEGTFRLLLDWIPNANHIPLYVGIEKGFFREEKIRLLLQKMHDTGGGISYLTSHQADLLVNHMPGTLKAAARGASLKVIGVLFKTPLSGFIYRTPPEISQSRDLSGRLLGYCLGGPDTLFLEFLLRQAHIEPAGRKNVSVDLISAMATHSVDFIYGGFWNIEPAQLAALGMTTGYIPIQELGVPNYCEMIILANDHTTAASPLFAAAFQRALQKSIDYCRAEPEEAFKIYARGNPDHRPKTLQWEREAWEKTLPLLARDQRVDREEVATFYSWLYDQKIVTVPYPTASLFPEEAE